MKGLAQYDLDFLTVHGDPHVVGAAIAGRGASRTKILAVTVLTSLDRTDLDDAMIQSGPLADITVERARRALAAGGRRASSLRRRRPPPSAPCLRRRGS